MQCPERVGAPEHPRVGQTLHHYPARDVKLFFGLRRTRREVLSVDEILPRHVQPIPGANFWLNLHRPRPPLRGWVMQQIIKLQMATKVNADLLLLADSDVLLVRPVTGETFRDDGRTRFYRRDNQVGSDLPRRVLWNDVLLSVPPEPPPLPDYISPFNVWDRHIAVALQERIQQTTGKHWLATVAEKLHFSEFFLYSVSVSQSVEERRKEHQVQREQHELPSSGPSDR